MQFVINGTDCTDLLWYGATTQWNQIRGSRGTCAVPFVIDPDTIFSPEAGESFKIYDPDSARVWSGTVEAIAVRWLGDDGWRVITVTGVSLEQLFDSITIEKVKYTGMTAGAIFTNLYSLSGVSAVGLSTLSDGPIVASLEVTSIAQGFNALALDAGFVWYVDPSDELLYFHFATDRAAPWTLGSTDILWDSIDWRQSREDLRTGQVIQLPGAAMQPVEATFNGDDVTTDFNLPTIPDYIISMVSSVGLRGRVLTWTAGTTLVTLTPALPSGATLTTRYSDGGLVSASVPGPGVGTKSLLYTKTRSFTPEGGMQEVTALLARFSMLPAQLTFATYKPGLFVGATLTIALTDPTNSADRLNGTWVIKELDGENTIGLDQLPDSSYGHFRYTARLINTASTAVFHGDGSTTEFDLPVIPSSVPNTRFSAGGYVATWTPGTVHMGIVPALADGDSVAVDFNDPANVPDPPSFVDTWEQLNQPDTMTPVVLSSEPPGQVSPGTDAEPAKFLRTLTLYDLTTGDDIAPHTIVYADGTALRLLAVLRKDLGSDLTVRINKGPQFAIEELITVTIPQLTAIDEVLEWSLATGSPATLGPFNDLEVLTADILESDGATDPNGIVQFTIEWTESTSTE